LLANIKKMVTGKLKLTKLHIIIGTLAIACSTDFWIKLTPSRLRD